MRRQKSQSTLDNAYEIASEYGGNLTVGSIGCLGVFFIAFLASATFFNFVARPDSYCIALAASGRVDAKSREVCRWFYSGFWGWFVWSETPPEFQDERAKRKGGSLP